MSAFGGKADMKQTAANVRLWPKADIHQGRGLRKIRVRSSWPIRGVIHRPFYL